MSARFSRPGEDQCDSHYKGIRCLCRKGHSGLHQDTRFNWPNIEQDLLGGEARP